MHIENEDPTTDRTRNPASIKHPQQLPTSSHLTHLQLNKEAAEHFQSKVTMSNWDLETESPVSAARLFKAGILDWHTLGPKLAPEVIASGAAIEGDGGVGSIRQINFTSVIPFKYIKERLDFVDHEKFECKSTIVEGGYLGSKLESASAHFKLEPTSSGGCLIKVVRSYKAVSGVDITDVIAFVQESSVKHIKAVEGYLIANPGAYA